VLADPIVLPFAQQPFYPEKIVHGGGYSTLDGGRSGLLAGPMPLLGGLTKTGSLTLKAVAAGHGRSPFGTSRKKRLGSMTSAFGANAEVGWAA
jgi:hypothetical protein